jgi:hypothetical protein
MKTSLLRPVRSLSQFFVAARGARLASWVGAAGLVLAAGSGLLLSYGQTPSPGNTAPTQQAVPGVNLKSFGARGDGRTDDTNALRAAVATAVKAGGGRVIIPPGIFRVTGPIDLPSGIIIEGSGSAYNGFCQLLLTEPNQKVFTIGENRRGIKIRDLEIKAQYASASPFRIMPGTIAIAAQGRVPNQSSIDIEFRGLSIFGFEKGISVEGSTAEGNWQFDQVLVDHCTIAEGKYGIYINSQNSTFWKISHCAIGTLAGGYAIYILRAGPVTIEDTLSSGPSGYLANRPETKARAFVYLGGGQGMVTITNGFGEGVDYFLEVGGVGNYTLPITVMGSVVGQVLFHSSVQYVSIGNDYYRPGAVSTTGDANDVLVQSIGDAVQDPELSGVVPPNGGSAFKLQGNGRVVFSSGLFGASFNNPVSFLQAVGIGSRPAAGALLNLVMPNNGQTHLRLGDTSGNVYNLGRDSTDGYMNFYGTQKGYTGFRFNGDLVPQQSGQGNLGTADKKWASVRALTITNGDLILSDKGSGAELYKIHEDENNIYFDDIRTGKRLMRLDRDGNLHLAGKVIQNSQD